MRNQLLTGYVLHQKPYQDNRSLTYFFSQEYGLVHGLGKKNLPLFSPIVLFATGKKALKTFNQAQLSGNTMPLSGQSLFAGMYLNELLIKLLPVEEKLAQLWQGYDACLDQICQTNNNADLIPLKWTLRQFETLLLQELGYAIDFNQDSLGHNIVAEQCYHYQLQQGFIPIADINTNKSVSPNPLTGQQILTWQQLLVQPTNFALNLESNYLAINQLLNQIGQLYRQVIDHLINYQPLQSRELWRQLAQLT